jgi:hypothetical protein
MFSDPRGPQTLRCIRPIDRTYVYTETTANAWGAVGARRVRAPTPRLTLALKLIIVYVLYSGCPQSRTLPQICPKIANSELDREL